VIELAVKGGVGEMPYGSVSEAAELLGVSRQRVHQLCKAGLLGYTRVSRELLVSRASVRGRLADLEREAKRGR
jgi:excisionase family DNA binding protein